MKSFFYRYILPYLAFFFIKLIFLSYRIRIIDPKIEETIYKRGESPIYISWHQRFFPGICLMAKRSPIAIMISQSTDGELISKIVEILGWRTVRGSSSRGGGRALIKLKRLLKEGYAVGHIVDGPRGPFGKIKPGLFAMAKHSGMPLLPTIVSSEKKWTFNSWDNFIIPKPFSKIIVRFDREVYIPKDINQERLEEMINQMECRLDELYRETDSIWLQRESFTGYEKLRNQNISSFHKRR
ncbi:MAG: lysophospholipid acyltransferase family protein [Spirochaetota bacterium]|nr:lysophospholipid acyltransferase family protein [Spirochaetota bacterium]